MFNPELDTRVDVETPPAYSPLYFVPHEDILVPEGRQRRTFNEESIKALAASIEKNGLLQPLAAEETAEGYRLIYGERRLRACRLLIAEDKPILHGTQSYHGLIPILEWGSLSPERRFEMELEENVQRENLPWQEQFAALAKLHQFRNRAPAAGVSQPMLETARQAKVGPQTLVAAVQLAPHLSDPDVAAAKNPKEALKIVEQKAAALHRAKLAVSFDLSKTPHTLRLGDARLLLKELPDASFDVICTDPPYGVGAQGFGEQARLAHDYDDRPEKVKPLLEILAAESYRVAKPSACCYLFCDFSLYDWLHLTMTLAGWHVRKQPIIWNKMGNGMLPVPDKEPRNTYELILFAYRDSYKALRQGLPDVLSYPPPTLLLHAAQKPAALLAELLARSALPGARILEPFAGSGSIFLACNSNRLVATAFEDNEATHNLALSRIQLKLEDEKLDLAPDLQL